MDGQHREHQPDRRWRRVCLLDRPAGIGAVATKSLRCGNTRARSSIALPLQQVRQLGDVYGDARRLVVSQGQVACGVVRRVGCGRFAPTVAPVAVLRGAPAPIDAIACTSCAVDALPAAPLPPGGSAAMPSTTQGAPTAPIECRRRHSGLHCIDRPRSRRPRPASAFRPDPRCRADQSRRRGNCCRSRRPVWPLSELVEGW